MFVLEFDEALFRFQQDGPQIVPFVQFPPKIATRQPEPTQKTLIFKEVFTGGCGPPSPSGRFSIKEAATDVRGGNRRGVAQIPAGRAAKRAIRPGPAEDRNAPTAIRPKPITEEGGC